MKLHQTLLSATLLVALTGTALAQAGRSIHVDLKETRLANGLRVITVEDHSAPVIAVAVTYNVGSRNEKQGRTGFAHLFEHMMFQGSENVGKSEHFMLIQNNGGQMNGTTNEDRTNYFEALPANQLELALYLESDRMRSLAVNQARPKPGRLTAKRAVRQSYAASRWPPSQIPSTPPSVIPAERIPIATARPREGK